MRPEMQFRRLGPDDSAALHAQSAALGAEAFGPPPAPPTGPPTGEGATDPRIPRRGAWPAGVAMWGAIDDGRLVGRVRTHEYCSYFGGAEVATTGIAGVAIAAEHRGRGLLAPLLTMALREQAAAAPLSGMFPTEPGIYRRLGFEVVTALQDVEIPTSDLTRIPAPDGIHLRRADLSEVADLDALAGVYATWARSQNGPLTRTGPVFEASDRSSAPGVGVTLAERDGQPLGYARWRRAGGYGPEHVLEVEDFVSLDPGATRALWRTLGSFSSVVGRVRLTNTTPDQLRLVVPSGEWREISTSRYAVRVLDVAGALSPRAYAVDGALTLHVTDDPAGLIDGTHRIEVREGRAAVSSSDGSETDGPSITVAGLSLLYAGTLGTANLRLAGLLSGTDAGDGLLDAWFGGRQVHIRDYY